MKEKVVIIGAGVVGCSIAHELVNAGYEVHVLEKNEAVGEGVTSRNSGVIHSGLYYKPDSLKAKHCIEGQALLYEWCREKKVPHQKTGKLIVALNKDEEVLLESLYKNALASGVESKNLEVLSSAELEKQAPYVKGVSALLAKESGVVDSHSYCHSFYVAAVNKGAEFHFNCEVRNIDEIEANVIINTAGLYADEMANLAGIQKYKIYPWRGDYFKIKLPYEVDKLIYPVVKGSPKGLGVHLTRDIQGQYFLGPDVEPASSKSDFTPREDKKEIFFKAASKILKDINPSMLTYETCGIRPKLRSFESNREKDFVISEDRPGFFNLVGIESPGLTAALSIAKHVRSLI